MSRPLFCVTVSLLVFCSLPLLAQQQPLATTYYACINNSTGAIRIVGQNTPCKSTEHKIHWNQVGPQGPKGPQGPPGVSVGYSAIAPVGSNIPIPSSPSVILQTNPIATSGSYYISASMLALVAAADTYVFCYDALASKQTGSQYGGSDPAAQWAQATLNDVLSVSAGDSVQLYCYTGGNNGTVVYTAALTATLINSADDATRPAGRPGKRPKSLIKH